MPSVLISAKDFVKGMSPSKYYPDKGFSYQSLGIEVSRRGLNFGLLRAGRTTTEYSTNLVDSIVATSPYYSNGLYYLSIGSSGNVYKTLAGATLTHTKLVTDGAKTYDSNSDILVFNGYGYITSTTDIALYDFGGGTIDNDWWTAVVTKTALTSGVIHKLIEFQGVMYIANGNKLWTYDGSTAKDTGVGTLTLPTNWVITDVVVYNNYLYISASYYYKGQMNTTTKIFVWDGYTENCLEEIPLDTKGVDFMKVIDGNIYFEADGLLYYLGGKQYKLVCNIVSTEASFPTTVNWKKALVNGSCIYFVGINGVWCYDTINQALSNPVKIDTSTNIINIISNSIYDYLEIYIANSKAYRSTSNQATTVTFYSNFYQTEQPVYIREIDILFSDNLASGSTYELNIYNEDEVALLTKTISYATDGAIIKKTIKGIDKIVDLFQVAITFNHSANQPIRLIRINYEPAGFNISK